jgi:hypothetical protein
MILYRLNQDLYLIDNRISDEEGVIAIEQQQQLS